MLSIFCIHRWHYITIFFLKNENSIALFVQTFEIFFQFSGLKHNISKFEIAGIGALKGVLMAVCGMNSIDLTTDFTKILMTCFSFNQTIREEANLLRTISSTQSVLKLWKIRILTLERRIAIFKSLTLWNIVFQSQINIIPN